MSILRTNQIQDTSGNSAMMINSSGVVTFPNAPFYAFAARKKLASGTDTGATGIIVFNNIQSNIGNAYSGADGRFTAPVAGVYSFSFHAMTAGSGGAAQPANTSSLAFFYKNNADAGFGRMQSRVNGQTSYANISGTINISLAVNDYITIHVASEFILVAHSQHFNQFSGHLIGVA